MLIIFRLIFALVWRILQRLFPTGCGSLDKMLGGGFLAEEVSLIYGEAETGKTSLAIQCVINCARMGYKSVFIDTDGTFSVERLSQIAYQDYEKISHLIILMKPTTFQEQIRTIDHLDEYVNRKIGLVVVDTITSLYSVELESPKETFALNRELNRQVALLNQIVKSRKVAALITSQVRSAFLGEQVSMEPVASRVLKFWSDVILYFKQTSQKRVLKVHLKKHPKLESSLRCYARIDKTGIRDYIR